MQPFDSKLIPKSSELIKRNEVDKEIISDLIDVNNHYY